MAGPQVSEMADSGHEQEPEGCYVDLAEGPLDVNAVLARVRSPKAGANVLFSGSTRDNFQGRAVATLCYSAYRPRALRSMREIAADIRTRHGLLSVAIVHRLGPVPIGEDSVLIAVSAPHRKAAWQAGEECLERVKERVEIWKQEVFRLTGDRMYTVAPVSLSNGVDD
ncbi:molybdopterin synthase large subunit [Grosmannia clavigera kw1407]|uniref:Molybdopterin synthase large subunit n=1 Tax=Grosmannia clavigera (strain kw1407 / UAMH 11150) TaxID=655863 RepID=F0XJ41_GROCL|nr:molybdopterin synthase large subunit [Grosmannia clavigera kw1407]EFX02139.1 molybdopterin synthase large subunit [Grosmannia clavigera kw1407]